MAIPASAEARVFHRCAYQRRNDAFVLLEAGRTTGAVYLAGYGIECILKALILSNTASAARRESLESFRGAKAHDYQWLRSWYLRHGGTGFPIHITRVFTLADDWSTDLRYTPRTYKAAEAQSFLEAADTIIRWTDGRIS